MTKRCLVCRKVFTTIPSRIKIGKGKYCSRFCYWKSKKGKPTWNKGVKGYRQPNISKALTGKKLSIETRRKMQLSHIGLAAGEKNPQWKGGITPIYLVIRNSFEYREWRKWVYKRDNYTCQICGERGGKLRANHIKKFSDYPKLRMKKSNGITICKDCDIRWVLRHEPDWESYFNFNLETRGFL